MITLLFILALAMLFSVIAFLIGLFKVLFQKDDKAFGIKLLIYSTVVFIIGFGTCAGILNFGGL